MALVGWLVGCFVLWCINHFDKSLKQFSLIKVLFFIYTQLHVKTVLFQTIQFNLSTEFQCQCILQPQLTGPCIENLQKHFYFKLFSFVKLFYQIW